MAEIRFSIVIVHRNGEKILLDALASLMRSVGRDEEIILVDNGSTDASVKQVRAADPTRTSLKTGATTALPGPAIRDWWRHGEIMHCFSVLTLGLLVKVRTRLMAYLTQLAWLLVGCPASWGLPDKCPRQS